MRDVIEQIACSVICREFWHYEPFCGLIVNNVRLNCMESMLSNHRLTEQGGAQCVGVPVCLCFGRWEAHSDMIVVVEGPKRASKVSSMHGFPPMLGV